MLFVSHLSLSGRNFGKLTGKHLCQCPFFNDVAGLRSNLLLKKRLRYRCFLVNSAEFKNSCFEEHVRTVASEKIYNYRSIIVKKIYCLISSNFLWICPRFKDSKELEETSANRSFSFCILFPLWKLMWSASFMSFNAIFRLLLFFISFLLQFSYLLGDYTT